jgi:hypothetical protein
MHKGLYLLLGKRKKADSFLSAFAISSSISGTNIELFLEDLEKILDIFNGNYSNLTRVSKYNFTYTQ